MKRRFYYVLLLALTALVTSCSKDETTSDSDLTNNYMVKQEAATTDQLSVTSDIETKVYGTLDNDFALCLNNRMKNQVTSFSDTTTKVCILSDDVIKSSKLTDQDYIDIFNCYKNGGAIIVTTPSLSGFGRYFQKALAKAAYYESVTKNNIRIGSSENEADLAAPALEEFDQEFLNIVKLEEKDLREGIMCDAIAFSLKGKNFIEDADAPQTFSTTTSSGNSDSDKTQDSVTVTPEPTAYHYGELADVLVEWTDDIVGKSTRATRSSISDLNEDINSYTMTITHPVYTWSLGHYHKYQGVLREKWTVNAAHKASTNTDYYLVDQDMEFFTDKVQPVYDQNDNTTWWYIGKGKGAANDSIIDVINSDCGTNSIGVCYIDYFDEWDSNISMTMDGCTPTIEKCSPQATNGSTTHTTSVADGVNWSNGMSVTESYNLGFCPTGLTGGVGLSMTTSASWGGSHTVSVGTSRPISDITIVNHSTDNVAKWTYKGADATMTAKSGTNHNCWNVGSLQISYMVQTNSVLFSIPNPKGKASLKAWNKVQYASLYTPQNTNCSEIKRAARSISNTRQLPMPYRALQNWQFAIAQDGYGDLATSDQRMQLWDFLMTLGNFPNKQSTFTLQTADANSTAEAQTLMNSIISNFKAAYTMSKGTFKFQLTRTSDKKVLQGTCTIE